MSDLKVNVVTPLGPVADIETDAVTAPGELGEFEVLPGHIPFLTALHPGVLTLGESGERSVYAVGPGYVRVTPEGAVEVLVEQCVAADAIDADAARTEYAEASRELEGWDADPSAEWRNLKARADWAKARVDAAG